MVFCGMYPALDTNFNALRDALETLHLNDSSFVFQPESSQALGPGFRCGFLGLLHMEVIQQRLERESDITVVQTAPNVTYEIVKRDGTVFTMNSAADLPPPYEIGEMREPVCSISIITPSEYIGTCMKLAENKRAKYISTEYLSSARVILNYRIPLAEMLYDFYDKLKSGTRGYGTMDYEFVGFEASDLVRVDFIVAQEKVDALATIFHRDVAEARARAIAKRLKKEINRHMFEVVIQAAINNRVVVRESIPALSKNVTGYLYGGDVTRKRKLWAKQKAGKKRMKQIGRVEIPQEAFMAVLKIE
jgi:GTP-binding protein LepA